MGVEAGLTGERRNVQSAGGIAAARRGGVGALERTFAPALAKAQRREGRRAFRVLARAPEQALAVAGIRGTGLDALLDREASLGLATQAPRIGARGDHETGARAVRASAR